MPHVAPGKAQGGRFARKVGVAHRFERAPKLARRLEPVAGVPQQCARHHRDERGRRVWRKPLTGAGGPANRRAITARGVGPANGGDPVTIS